MTKKKLYKGTAIILTALMLTGCGMNKIPDLSHEEMVLVENYAAALLLEHDMNYKTKLLNEDQLRAEVEMRKQIEEEARRRAELEAQREAAEAEKKKEKDSVSGNSRDKGEVKDNAVDFEDFLGLDGFTIECTGVDFVDSFSDPGDEQFFAITPSPGAKIAVTYLHVTNTLDTANNLDILNKNAKFKLSFNGGAYHNTMVALLLTDFTMYAGEIGPGESTDLVMLVDLPENECTDIYDLDLNIKYNGEGGRCSLIGDL